jgi:hypothetical protein
MIGQVNDSELMTIAISSAKPTSARSTILAALCNEARRKLYGIELSLVKRTDMWPVGDDSTPRTAQT